MTKRIEEIELHSKEVNDLLGRVPSWLIRNGMIMVVSLLLLLVVGSWLFKYPDIIVAPVVVTTDREDLHLLKGYVQLKGNWAGKVRIGQQVNLKFVNYPYLEFGVVKGSVSKIAPVPTGDFYLLEVNLPTQLVSTVGKKLEFERELKGTAEIITDRERLLSRILQPLRTILGKKQMQ